MDRRGSALPPASALGSRSDLLFLAAVLLAFGLARWWCAGHYPWRIGFDDADHISAGLLWAEHWRLSDEGPFLRVPFWPMLLGTFFRPFGVAVMFAGLKTSIRRAVGLGVLCGVAAMTKIAATALAVPALAMTLRSKASGSRARFPGTPRSRRR